MLRACDSLAPPSAQSVVDGTNHLSSSDIRFIPMPLELHIYGSAFSLPSIDPHCLAAIAYLRSVLPSSEWNVIPCSDPTLMPVADLPALKDGETWLSGYRAICNYIDKSSEADGGLDAGLEPQQRADLIAYEAFLESRGQPLLDLCLYVSSENYNDYTSPALAKVLSWPASWVLPHRLRDRAKGRSEHLGLSGLDIDAARAEDERKKQEEEARLGGQIPKALQQTRLTVTSMLGRGVKQSRFRLEAVTDAFLEPLQELLEDKKWLLGEQITSLDCLAIGYLALMKGQMPSRWIAEAMDGKYTKLGKWVVDAQQQLLGVDGLSWAVEEERSWSTVSNAVCTSIIENVPGAGMAYLPTEIKVDRKGSSRQVARQKQNALTNARSLHQFYSQVLGSSVCVAIATGLAIWNGVLRLPSRASGPSSRSFGEAGAMLGLG